MGIIFFRVTTCCNISSLLLQDVVTALFYNTPGLEMHVINSMHMGISYHKHCALKLDRSIRKQILLGEPVTRVQQLPTLCGQSRTTISNRHFASLIGRLWVGGI
jgi:hypothetical protein